VTGESDPIRKSMFNLHLVTVDGVIYLNLSGREQLQGVRSLILTELM
jgi:hypothetical protein